jgi:adenine-specific DNA-methyltransferase
MPINKIKENGVVYTPAWIVKSILDLSNYKNNIYNKKVIDPACGDGAFLSQILERMILDAKKNKIKNEEIYKYVSRNLYGFDIDRNAINLAKLKLNNICKTYGIYSSNLRWRNIRHVSSLSNEIMEKYKYFFDWVFGNPPYVRIQNLNKKLRKNIISKFLTCKSGSTDLYIAFFELGNNFLNKKGVMGYITPNSFLNSATGKELRNLLFEEKNIQSIVNFEHHQLFENATTYSLISIINKNYNDSKVKLYNGNSNLIDSKFNIIDLNLFKNENWILKDSKIIEKINTLKNNGIPLNKLCKIHTGLATLSDSLYIFKDPQIIDDIAKIVLKDGRIFDIEKSILKKTIKASTWKSADDDQKIYSIFPYKKINNKFSIIPENDLKKDFPLTYKYFLSVKEDLLKRDNGKKNSVSWYAYGRAQGINTAFCKKIITAAINLKPKFIVCEDEDTLYYAGYSVLYDGDLHKLSEKLNSDDMKFYIDNIGKDYQGGYKSYAKSFIKDFGVII